MKRIVLACALMSGVLSSYAQSPHIRFHALPETSYYGGIHSIATDSLGRLWFSGADAVFRFGGDSFENMTRLVTSQEPERPWSMGFLTTDREERLYLATNHGLQRFNGRYNRFERVLEGNIGALERTADASVWLICDGKVYGLDQGEKPLPADLNPDPMRLTLNASGDHLYVASGGRIFCSASGEVEWKAFADFGTNPIADVLDTGERVYVLTLSEGLYECSPEGTVLRRFTLPIENDRGSTAKQLHQHRDGIIWVGTQYGLMLVCPNTGKTELLRSNLQYPFSLPGNSVWSFCSGPEGTVWVGTYGGKLALATEWDSDVEYWFKASPGGLGHPIVSCFCEDAEGRLWVGTEGGGITVWDRKRDQFSYYTQQDGSGLVSNLVKKLWVDDEGTLWVAFFNSGVQTFDARTGRWRTLPITRGPRDPSLSVYELLPDGQGGLWMSDPDADLMHADLKNGKIEVMRGERRRNVETFFRGEDGNLWLITRSGIQLFDPDARKTIRTIYLPDQPYAVNNLCCYGRTSDGDLLFGTKGAGVNILHPDGRYENLPMNGRTVFGILEDPVSGDVWMSTDDGLHCLRNGRLVASTVNNPSHCGAFYVRSAFRTSRGELLFGGTDGFILVNPAEIKTNGWKPSVFFTDIRVNDESLPTQRYIGTQAPLDFRYNQSNIDLRFSSDSYLRAENNRYSCRLAGLDDSWTVLPPGQKSMRYYNLKPGNYRFEVRASNNDGLWGDDITGLAFTIRPSPFLTWWAKLIYSLLLMGIAVFIWRYFTNRKVYREQKELEKMKEDFFTSISHDLKTPLSLIVDPLRQLKEHIPEDSSATKYTRLIERSVTRMQRMIGQLLTFRQIESRHFPLHPRRGELVSFLESIFSLFELYANRQGIEMEFHSQFESYHSVFDHEVIEKIFTNLFSNAVKYTTLPGLISVQIGPSGAPEGPGVSVSVANTGTANLDKGFEPQFESSTGLGLAIVKQLVTQLGGEISASSVDSRVTFTVSLPLPKGKATDEDDASDSYVFVEKEINALVEEMAGSERSDRRSRKSDTVVVIDDNRDLRNYLEEHLSAKFNVYVASGGAEGLETVERVRPQVVITDLMMAETDGFEVCRTLRGSFKSSHIPVIVLSGDSSSKVKALESGANVFIEKPFEMDYLLSQVDGLLRMQAEFREHFSKRFVAEPAKLVISSLDEQLLSRAMAFIEKNMDNNDYDVDEFVFDMAVGRTILYQKIKDLTGMSIKEFILDIRLKRAAQLLKDSDLNVAEVSDRTGFANPKYFSVCFKRRWNLSPSEFKKQENPQ